ncbi:cytochrome bd oxidase small subunit CydS [Gordoniibacillus kamchatkensis]
MEHFLITWAPPLAVLAAFAAVFWWAPRGKL